MILILILFSFLFFFITPGDARSVRFQERDIRYGIHRQHCQGESNGTHLNRGRGGQGKGGHGSLLFDPHSVNDLIPAASTLQHYQEPLDLTFGVKTQYIKVYL